MPKKLEYQLLVDTVRFHRAALLSGSKTPQQSACEAMAASLGQTVPFSSFRRRLGIARAMGLTGDEPDAPAAAPVQAAEPVQFPVLDVSSVERNLCDFTKMGWRRDRPVDTTSDLVDRDGNITGTKYTLDPGIIYPADWTGPFLRDKPKVKATTDDGVKRFLLTAIQDHTPAHGPFLVNLRALSLHLGAEVSIGQFTYARRWYEAIFGSGVRDKRKSHDRDTVRAYPTDLDGFLTCERRELSPSIWWCPEVNILPTAQNPVSDLQTYGKGRSVVFSHPKQELESVPRDPSEVPIVAYSTGVANPPNYVAKKAGQKAAFHHIIGALLVEIDADGFVYTHHIHADAETGKFQVYDIVVDNGAVSTGHAIPGITFGDGHIEHLDEAVAAATFGIGECDDVPLIDALLIEDAFTHDVQDFYSRNHHNKHDPWHLYAVANDNLTVRDEITRVGKFLSAIRRPWMRHHVVESNHDLALARWLKETDWREDLLNAELYLELNLTALQWVRAGLKNSIFEHAVRLHAGPELDDVDFLAEDQPYIVAGVQCGWHSHNGPNGSRGTTRGLLRLARRISKGHDHTPTKKLGVTSAGTCQRLMPKWAKGPTTWAHAHTLIYPGGHTSLVFVHAGRWRALGTPRNAEFRRAA